MPLGVEKKPVYLNVDKSGHLVRRDAAGNVTAYDYIEGRMCGGKATEEQIADRLEADVSTKRSHEPAELHPLARLCELHESRRRYGDGWLRLLLPEPQAEPEPPTKPVRMVGYAIR